MIYCRTLSNLEIKKSQLTAMRAETNANYFSEYTKMIIINKSKYKKLIFYIVLKLNFPKITFFFEFIYLIVIFCQKFNTQIYCIFPFYGYKKYTDVLNQIYAVYQILIVKLFIRQNNCLRIMKIFPIYYKLNLKFCLDLLKDPLQSFFLCHALNLALILLRHYIFNFFGEQEILKHYVSQFLYSNILWSIIKFYLWLFYMLHQICLNYHDIVYQFSLNVKFLLVILNIFLVFSEYSDIHQNPQCIKSNHSLPIDYIQSLFVLKQILVQIHEQSSVASPHGQQVQNVSQMRFCQCYYCYDFVYCLCFISFSLLTNVQLQYLKININQSTPDQLLCGIYYLFLDHSYIYYLYFIQILEMLSRLTTRIAFRMSQQSNKEVIPKAPKLLSGQLAAIRWSNQNNRLYEGYTHEQLFGALYGGRHAPEIQNQMRKDTIVVSLLWIFGVGWIINNLKKYENQVNEKRNYMKSDLTRKNLPFGQSQ